MKTLHQQPVPCHANQTNSASKYLSALASRAAVGVLSLTALTLPASAAVLLLVTEPPPGTNQADTDTCVIAATNCPQNLIDFTWFTNALQGQPYEGWSPAYVYDPAFVYKQQNLGGLRFAFTYFDVAIDAGVAMNGQGQLVQGQTLRTFEVQTLVGKDWITRDSYQYAGTDPNIGNISNPLNGNGFSDYLLRSVDLSSLAPGTSLRFYAVLENLTGGPESFFIKVVDSTIPNPGSLALLGAGMLGLGLMLRPRRT